MDVSEINFEPPGGLAGPPIPPPDPERMGVQQTASPTAVAIRGAKPVKGISPMNFPDPPDGPSAPLRGTADNLAHLLDCYGIGVRFNVLKKRPEIYVPGLSTTDENRDAVVLSHIEDLAIRHRMSSGRVAGHLLALADSSPFDPLGDWIDSKPWDGEDRLPAICETVVPQEGYPVEFRDVLVRKWLLSIVAATYHPQGFRARGALTFQGDQGIGKTSWFKRLVGDPKLRDQAIKLGHSWDGGSKDAKLTAIRHRIVEWGELEGSFRREIAGLKAFITEDYDKIRPPYARTEAEYARRTVFGASVNESDFLLDATGNSRFWTIAVERLDYLHDIDMQQVFAQLKVAYQAGERWWLDREEEAQLEEINRRHRNYGAVGEKINEALDMALKGRADNPRESAGEVLRKLGFERPTNPQFKEANAILRELLGPAKKVQGVYKWYVPWADSNPRATDLLPRSRVQPEEVY
jgi:predicted P-loop ATPase